MSFLDFILGFSSEFSNLKGKVSAMEPVVEELQNTVAGIKAAVPEVKAAVDALEAAVTAATNNGGMSQEDKDAITQASADLRDALQGLTDAVADARDGTDEGAGNGQ